MGCAGVAVATALPLLVLFIFALRPHKQNSLGRLEFAIPVQSEVSHLALSPDGKMLAVVSPDDASGANMLTVQRVGSPVASLLQGTEGANYPFWSPDDSSVGFFADGKLKKIAASGGSPQILALAPNARGGSWSINGVIIYSPDAGGPLWKVNADGSGAAPLTDKMFDRKKTSSRTAGPYFCLMEIISYFFPASSQTLQTIASAAFISVHWRPKKRNCSCLRTRTQDMHPEICITWMKGAHWFLARWTSMPKS